MGISGPYTLFLVVDALHQVYQSGVTIDSQALPISLTLSPPPDLEVSNVSAPTATYTDQLITVNWTVTNQGTGPAAPETWDDSVYLSTDQFLTTSSAIILGSVQHTGGLAAGASYSASLTAKIPDYASGPYYVFVVTDSGNLVFEAMPSGSHQAYDPTAVLVTMPPPCDLTVTAITVPATGTAGQLTATPLTWTVTNVGSNPAVGNWADNIYLSPDGAWNASDPLIGQFFHYGDLAPGASYTVQDPVGVPGILPGNYYVIVRTDALGNEREANPSNNQLTSTSTIDISIPTLTLGQTITPTLGLPGDLYYQFTAQAGQTIDITAEVPSPTTQYEFFLRYGAPPTFDQFDQEYPYSFDTQQQLSIKDAQQGTYYLLFHDISPISGPTQLQISSKIETFEVDSVSPALGSNVGDATVTITGAEFTPGAVVSLIASDGTTRTASQVWWKDSGTLWAIFDLTGLATGSYDLSVTDGGQTVTDPGAFTVTDGQAGFVKVHLLVPSSIRDSNPFGEVEVVYTNPGDTDVVAPILSLSSLGDSTSIGASLRVPGQTSFGGTSVQFLALNSAGPAGVLPPRSSFTYTIDFTTSTHGTILWSLGEASPAAPIDWASDQAGLQLPTIPDAAWPAVFANFVANVGSTWGSYVAALANDATYLSQLGTYDYNVNQLLSFELEKANAAFTAQTLATVTAESLPAPGMDLTFVQSFQQSIAGRYTQGILGYGWTTNWDIFATTTANGDVAIYNDGVTLYYTLQPDSSYTDEVGDHSTLTLVNGDYLLKTTDGMLYQFNPDGTLAYIQDSNGNRISTSYDAADQLVSLTDSNGEYLTLTYNAQGHLAQLTDSSGQTETYGYDPTGQFLTSYTDIYGTTTYTYITGQSPQQDNALAEVAYADSTHIYFSYDSQGRLIDQHRDGGADDEAFTYLSPGGYTVRDGDGNTSTVLFNLYGATAETIDPLGNVFSYKYDSNLNLIEVDGPQGTKYTATYDSLGNLTSETDPLGQTTTFTYNGNNDLTSYTDAKGNTTSYSYNGSNDLLSITYANGTQQQYSYNPLGEATQYLDARGQAIGYTYNADGLVTQATFSDGTSYSYTYDNLGNLTSATDSQGNVTTYLYANPSNPTLLTKVEYPDGTYLAFTYNVIGQRTQSVDQTGFTVNYAYDAIGRLSKLTDGSGNLIVQYTYNAAGNLIQKDMGNGTRTVYTYDPDGNVLSIVNLAPDHTAVNSFDDYTYDALGNILTDTNQDGEWTYNYDADSQLIHAVFTPNASDPDGLTSQDIEYVYDAAGNRVSQTVNGVMTTYAVNNVNEYTSSTTNGITTNYQYDADGNLVAQSSSSGTVNYSFNDLNQLTGVNGPGLSASYTYNPLGDLVAQTVNGVSTRYQVDPTGTGNVVAAFGRGGTLMAHFTYGLGLTSQVSANGTAGYYDFNNIGSTIGITGARGNYVNQYTYLPFGQTMTINASLTNPFQFVGEWRVNTILGDMSLMGGRVDVPSLGRFISPDPLGVLGSGSDLYGYAGNNPTRFIDPLGLCENSPEEALDGILDVLEAILDNSLLDKLSGVLGSDPTAWALAAILGKLLEGVGASVGAAEGAEFGLLVGGLFGPEGAILGALVGDAYGPEIGAALGRIAGTILGGVLGGHGGSALGAEGGGACPCECPPSNPPQPPLLPLLTMPTTVIHSRDPNDLFGPAAYGDQNFVAADTPLPYTIDFENEPTATAPAQTITITDQLSSYLEWRTFQLGAISFGGETIVVPAGLSFYAAQVNLRPRGIDLLVRIDAGIDPTTGIVTWTLTSIDPATGEPPTDPTLGLLPPDDANGDGEGFVTYTTQPKAGLPTGTVITSQASVVFDTNPSLNTNTVTDTLDAVAPTSTVAPLPATEEDQDFTVSWSGQDDTDGSGLAFYSIYVSDNGGPFTPWLSGTTDTSDTYNGQPGHTYAFYSVATDNVGNVEATPTAAQASTTVEAATQATSISTISGSGTYGGTATLTATLTASGSGVANEPVTFTFINGMTITTVGTATTDANGVATLTGVSLAGIGAGTYTGYVGTSFAGDANYDASSGSADLTVAQAPLAVTANPAFKTYGDADPAFTVSYTGFVAGDGASSLSGSASFATTEPATGYAPVGTYTITPSGLMSPNYKITYVGGTLTVNPRALSVTANDASQTYGAPTPTLTYTLSGFAPGENATTAGVTGSPVLSTAAQSSGVGSYAITVAAGTLAAANYSFPNLVAGTLTITPAPLTITANNQSMVYGAPLPALTASYSGFVNGDTPSSLATPVTLSTNATASSPVGPYAIQASGATSANYLITFNDGTLTINQASTTTTLASSANPSVYGQSVTFTATVAAVAPGSGTPTGSVTLMDGSTTLGTGTLTGGVVTFNTSTLNVASHSITAVYGGDSNFTMSTSAALSQAVNQDSTSTALTSSVNPIVFGQSVSFTATVTANAPGAGTPTGSISFMEGSTTLDTESLSLGHHGQLHNLGTRRRVGHDHGGLQRRLQFPHQQLVHDRDDQPGEHGYQPVRRADRHDRGRNGHAHGSHHGGGSGGGHADGLRAVLRRHDIPGHRRPQRQHRDPHDDHSAGRDRLRHGPVPGRPQLHGQYVERCRGHDQPLRHCHDHHPHLLHQSFGLRPVGHLHCDGGVLIGRHTHGKRDLLRWLDAAWHRAAQQQEGIPQDDVGAHRFAGDQSGLQRGHHLCSQHLVATHSNGEPGLDNDQSDFLGEPVGLWTDGDAHGDSEGGLDGKWHADWHGDVLRRHDGARHRHSERWDNDNFDHILESRLALDHGCLRRRYRLHRQHLAGTHPNGQPGSHHDSSHFCREPVDLWAAIDVHGHGERELPRQRDADRHDHVLRRVDAARHGHAQRRDRQPYHVATSFRRQSHHQGILQW